MTHLKTTTASAGHPAIPCMVEYGMIDLADLRAQDMTPCIIGAALARIPRFNGRTTQRWSVAEHSVLVEALVAPEYKPWALLHDAHEAFIGDITQPAVDLFEYYAQFRSSVRDSVDYAKGRIDKVIGQAWNVPVRSLVSAIRRADHIAMMAEAIRFMNVEVRMMQPGDEDDVDRALSLIDEMPFDENWMRARDLWLGRVQFHVSLGLMSPPRVGGDRREAHE